MTEDFISLAAKDRTKRELNKCLELLQAIHTAFYINDYKEVHRLSIQLQEHSGSLTAYSFLTSRQESHG